MRRMITAVAAATATTLTLAACGGGDDSADDTAAEQATSVAETQVSSSEPDAAPTESTQSTSTEVPAGDDESGDDETGADEPADEMVEADTSGGRSIASIDDVPPRCRDLMADFLEDIEPIVGQLDWQTATAEDFEQIAPEFEQFAEAYDTEAAAEECDDLELDEDTGFDLIIEFADDVAPGTVPFFEFLDGMLAGLPTPGADDATAGETATSDAIETCEQMIDGFRGLMDEYDSFDQMPLSELTKYSGIGTIMMTCTPEQLELLGSDEFEAFLNG